MKDRADNSGMDERDACIGVRACVRTSERHGYKLVGRRIVDQDPAGAGLIHALGSIENCCAGLAPAQRH